ncbi:MAG: aminomethyltransferase family protein [Acidobacteriota bacterium]
MPKGSPLYSVFASQGARFLTRYGRELPEQVSGLEDEYRAAGETVIAADRSHRGRIRVLGRDAIRFLQNMLSNDVRSLAPGAGVPATFLTRKGTLVSDLIAYRMEEGAILETEVHRVVPLQEALSRYIVSEDVTLADATDGEALISLEGPCSGELLSRLSEEAPPELRPYHFVTTTLRAAGGASARVSAVSHGPGPGFDMAITPEQAVGVLERIIEVGAPLGLRLAGHLTLEVRRVEAGIPLFGVDMDESRLPFEAGLEKAISFDKGCYVGQEYVARLAHRGHLNRKLVGLHLEGESVPSPGSEVLGQSRSVGRVTSAVYSPTLGHPIALGYLHRDFLEPGTEVTVHVEDRELAARVAELPFLH